MGALIGRVVDAASGEPVAAGTVVVRWAELLADATGLRRALRSLRARVDGGGREIDNFVNPAELGGVEVYADPAFAPPEYARGSCASVVLWTKGALR